jgi:hypothetical protein
VRPVESTTLAMAGNTLSASRASPRWHLGLHPAFSMPLGLAHQRMSVAPVGRFGKFLGRLPAPPYERHTKSQTYSKSALARYLDPTAADVEGHIRAISALTKRWVTPSSQTVKRRRDI